MTHADTDKLLVVLSLYYDYFSVPSSNVYVNIKTVRKSASYRHQAHTPLSPDAILQQNGPKKTKEVLEVTLPHTRWSVPRDVSVSVVGQVN